MGIDACFLAALSHGTRGPYIVGGTGGSGTHVVVGSNLNVSDDALEFGDYSDRWINTFMAHKKTGLPQSTRTEMVKELRAALEKHLARLDTTARAWGWKEPRSAFLLPFFHSQMPMLKFLHVVRDGRDMAYSSNQNQLMKHGGTLSDSTEAHWSQPLRSMALWSRLNMLVAAYAERNMDGQYMVVRFDDLCTDPIRTIVRMLEFFRLEGDVQQITQLEVDAPESMGRWRDQDEETLEALQRIGREALTKFPYPVHCREHLAVL